MQAVIVGGYQSKIDTNKSGYYNLHTNVVQARACNEVLSSLVTRPGIDTT